jgi:hypothetical protein
MGARPGGIARPEAQMTATTERPGCSSRPANGTAHRAGGDYGALTDPFPNSVSPRPAKGRAGSGGLDRRGAGVAGGCELGPAGEPELLVGVGQVGLRCRGRCSAGVLSRDLTCGSRDFRVFASPIPHMRKARRTNLPAIFRIQLARGLAARPLPTTRIAGRGQNTCGNGDCSGRLRDPGPQAGR